MIINTDQIKDLLNQRIPDLTLARETGITRQTFYNLRKDRSNLDKMWLGTAAKLQSYIDNNVHYSRSDDGLLDEAKADLTEFGDQPVLAVFEEQRGHEFIVDYMLAIDGQYPASQFQAGDIYKAITLKQLVDQLITQSSL